MVVRNVFSVVPWPFSRFFKARTLIPACSARDFWSMFFARRKALTLAPMLSSIAEVSWFAIFEVV